MQTKTFIVYLDDEKPQKKLTEAPEDRLLRALGVKTVVRNKPKGQLEIIQENARVNFHPNYKTTSDRSFPIVFICDVLSDQGTDGSQELICWITKSAPTAVSLTGKNLVRLLLLHNKELILPLFCLVPHQNPHHSCENLCTLDFKN